MEVGKLVFTADPGGLPIFLPNLLIFHLDKYLSKYEYVSKYVK